MNTKPVHLAHLHHIGKETNRLDDRQAGVTSPDQALTHYDNPSTALTNLILPALAHLPARCLAEYTSLTERQINNTRSGKPTPRPETQQALTRLPSPPHSTTSRPPGRTPVEKQGSAAHTSNGNPPSPTVKTPATHNGSVNAAAENHSPDA